MVYFQSIRDYLVPPERRQGVPFVRPPQPAPAAPVSPPAAGVDVGGDPPILLHRLREFYERPGNFEKLKSHLGRSGGSVSLRILDFLCSDNGLELAADTTVSDGYQHMLKTFSKSFFDVFARGERLEFAVNGESVTTTLGQLNFFRWAIESGLLCKVVSESERLRHDVRKRPRGDKAPEPVPKRTKQHQGAVHVRLGGPFHVKLERAV